MADDFAMRHRARRAAQLAETVRRTYEALDDTSSTVVALAERLTEEQWETVAAITGIRPPSEITKNLVIGLLSVPEQAKGLIHECP
jgi:hypothetical protein